MLSERKFSVSLNLQICFESNKPCDIDIQVFTNTKLPKKPCDWTTDFINEAFSFASWKSARGITTSGLTANQQKELMEDLGLSQFVNKDLQKCSSSNAPFAGAVDNWKNECPLTLKSALPSLSAQPITCHVDSSCGGLHCCINVASLSTTFTTKLEVDPCNYKMTVGIEKLVFSKDLFTYEWGKEEQMWMFGVVRMKFRAVDLYTEGFFLMNLKLEVCLEASQVSSCGLSVDILQNFYLPKKECVWNAPFITPGFNLTSWRATEGVADTVPMDSGAVDNLLSDLKTAGFQLFPSCAHTDSTYQNAAADWAQYCPEVVQTSLSSVSDKALCAVSSGCTSIRCCVAVPLLNRTFEVSLEIDESYYTMRSSVEKMQRRQSLVGYTFGTEEMLSINGVFKLVYKVNDLVDGNMFDVSMAAMACFVDGGDCEFSLPILTNALIPKTGRQWNDTFTTKDSLSQWLSERSLTPGAVLPSYRVSELFETFSLKPYLQSTACAATNAPYSGGSNGWKNDCAAVTSLSTLTSDPLNCHLDSNCNKVSCCVDSTFTSRTFEAVMDIDPCTRTLTLEIEDLKAVIPWSEIKWSTPTKFYLYSVVRIDYVIHDLYAENFFLVDLKISMCWELYGDCVFVSTVFQNTFLPKRTCPGNMDFKNAGFSLSTYASSNSLDQNNLQGNDLAYLYDYLGISSYLNTPTCNRSEDKYTPSTNGWTSNCTTDLTSQLPALDSMTNCAVDSSCTSVDCCMEVPKLSAHPLNFHLSLDDCDWMISYGMDGFVIKPTVLYDFTFDQWNEFWMRGVFRMKFKVTDLSGLNKFRVSLIISVCFESGSACGVEQTILNNAILPKPQCDLDIGTQGKDFVLNNWKSEKGVTTMEESSIARLEEDLDMFGYLNKAADICNKTAGIFASPATGWTNDCPTSLLISLPVITGPLTCNLGSSCSVLTCCVYAEPLSKHVTTVLNLDFCHDKMTVGIDRFSREIRLSTYQFWGQQQTLDFSGIFQVNFTIDDLPYSNLYLVSYALGVCWEGSSNCEGYAIMTNILLPKTTSACNWKADFVNPAFSLSTWQTSNSHADSTPLTEQVLQDLMKYLQMSRYKDEDCVMTAPPYTPNNGDGWNITCPDNSNQTALPSTVACHLPDSCTGLDCCVSSSKLGRKFRATLDIDPCTSKVSVGIDKWKFSEISLDTITKLETEMTKSVWLQGVVRMDFTVENLWSADKYLVNLKISICLSVSGACEVENITIFENAVLPKKPCNFNSQLPSGFSLSSWKTSHGFSSADRLPVHTAAKVQDFLKLPQYRLSSACSRTLAPYSPTYTGWVELNSGCRIRGLPFNLRQQTYCVVESSCTKIQCCTDDSEFQSTITWFIDMDSCNHQLEVGIEGLKSKVSLLNYKFGEQNLFSLGGVYQLSYVIHDLSSESHYLMSVNVSICYEPNNCSLSEIVVQDVMFPKPVCDFKSTNFKMTGFELSTWSADHGFTVGTTLPDYGVMQLLKDLGLAMYMKETTCTPSDNVYVNNTDGWQKECSFDIATTALSSGIVCHIPSTCTTIQCCVDATTPLGRSFTTVLDLDPCTHQLTLGIENFVLKASLYDFEFAKEQYYYLNNVVRMKYAVYDLKIDRKYLVDLSIALCFSTAGPCVLDTVVLQHVVLPKRVCNLYAGYSKTNFSLSAWKTENAVTSSDLSSTEIALLHEDLGISEYMMPSSCSRQSGNYIPHTYYWSDACGKVSGMTQFTSGDNINCYLASSCTQFTCCMDDLVVQRLVDIQFTLDNCNFNLHVQIEKRAVDISLLDYKWGTLEKMDLFGIYVISFTIENLYREGAYLLSVNISQCYEANQDCAINHVLFTNSLLPKSVCNWSTDYKIANFSLLTWKMDRSLGSGDIPDVYLLQLLEETGLAGYVKQPTCDKTAGVYTGATNGWTKACSASVTLPTLTSDISCHLDDTCTGLQCCVATSQLNRSYEVYFSINHCTSSLSIQIEKVFYNRTLVGFPWGTEQEFRLQGIYRVKYTLDDLPHDRAYLVSMQIMDCYQTSDPQCIASDTFTVLDNSIIPKALCSWDQSFITTNFSLTDWLSENGLADITALSNQDHKQSQLLDQLSVSQYLLTTPCTPTSSSAVDGWTQSIDCLKTVTKPSVSGSLCNLKSDCTSSECCTEIDFLKRSLHTYLDIDPCNFVMKVGIEKFNREISLADYQWGKSEQHWLAGVVRMDFTIEDLYGSRQFLVNLDMKFCFESYGDCYKNFTVFKDTLLPKKLCPFTDNPGFSLSAWKDKQGIAAADPLPAWAQVLLLEELDIAQYMDSAQCVRGTGLYGNTVKMGTDTGFNQNAATTPQLCQLSVDLTANALEASTASQVSCYLPTLCTAVDCCVDVPAISTSFNAHVEIDPCKYMLRVRIDKFSFNKSLDQYTFGTDEMFYMAGILRLMYNVRDLPNEKLYVVTVKLSVCTDSSGCEANHTIFENMLLPKQPCSWSEGFVNTNFSVSAWMSSNSYTPTLLDYQALELMNEMKAARYLLETPCDLAASTGIYSNPVDGWNKWCPSNLKLNNLTGQPMVCHLDANCKEVDCCVQVDTARRTLRASLNLDPCSQIMTVKLERFTIKVDLMNYAFGTTSQYSLVGMLRMDVNVKDLTSKNEYVVDLDISVCFESNGTCAVVASVLSNSHLPKTTCDWSTGLQGFSLKNWLEMTMKVNGSTSPLPQYLQHLFFEERGIANLMKDTPCNQATDALYAGIKVNGWISLCSTLPTLPPLASGITCNNPTSCSAATCCMDITRLNNLPIEVSIEFHECANYLDLSIERIPISIPLHTFDYGKEQKLSLKGVFEIVYTITRNVMERKYYFDLAVSACYESTGCDQTYVIFNQTAFDIKQCTYNDGFLNPVFSLANWMSTRSIPGVENITNVQANELLLELGLDHFLSNPDRCSLDDAVYGAANEYGWNNECTSFPNDTISNITDTNKLRCHIPSTCDRVTCCVYVQEVHRHAKLELNMDTCNYQMEGAIDNLRNTYPLFDYSWAKNEQISLLGVIRWGYHVTHVSSKKKFLVDGTIKLCFEQASCSFDTSLFQDLSLGYQSCVPTDPVPFQGVSFDFWRQTQCTPLTYVPNLCANIVGVSSTSALANCNYLSDCSGLECCIDSAYTLGNRSIYFQIKVDCNNIEYQIETKSVSKSLAALTDGVPYTEDIGTGPSFRLTYQKTQNALNYAIGASLTFNGVTSDPSETVTHDILDASVVRFDSTSCVGKKRRRRRQAQNPNQLDPTNFSEGLRILMKNGATSEQIEAFKQQCEEADKAEKEKNLQATPVSDEDFTTSVKSGIDALGSGNPMTIQTSGALPGTITVQGGDAITGMIGQVTEIAGRAKQAFIVGQGLSPEGAKLLGKKLACMTIGDLEGLLEMKNIDPFKVIELMGHLKDLAKALYSEFITKLFSDSDNIFKSFDLELKGDFSFPKQNINFFKFNKIFFVGGIITMTFGFGADGYYGMKFVVGAKVMDMKASAGCEPYGGVSVWGELGIGALLYGKLRLEGNIMDMGFPTTAEISFKKFPLDVQLQMYLRLTPIKLTLYALVTLEVDLGFTSFKKVLFKTKLWRYKAPTIMKLLIDNTKKEEDESPPEVKSFGGDTKEGECGVLQEIGRDHTEPEFTVFLEAEDDRSNVILTLDVGTVPGGTNVLSGTELGGFSTTLNEILQPAGVPLFFTVIVANEAGNSVRATCSLPTYDMTIPGGRMTESFRSTSNPRILKGTVTVYDDSVIAESRVAVGFGKDIYGEQIIRWSSSKIEANTIDYNVSPDPLHQKVLTLFSDGKLARLVGKGILSAEYEKISTPGECATLCNSMHVTKCLSFNYDFGTSGHCELLEAIEGHDFKTSQDGLYMHYEKLGVGSNKAFEYNNLQMLHNKLHFFNFQVINVLGYQNILSSHSIITDFTPPLYTESQMNVTSDIKEVISCEDIVPNDRVDWERIHCVGVDAKFKNHRVVVDGEGSETVYNGHEFKTDLKYTRANRYVSANWDGIYDHETGLLGYSVTVGTALCEEKLKEHHDPHAHLFDPSQWTNSVMMTPLVPPQLPDGKYYVTVRAINKIDYGGPLALTICHSTPYIIDNSPPIIYEIYNIKYDEDKFNLSLTHNSTDPDSGLNRNDFCLGRTTRDCDELMWKPIDFNPNITLLHQITNGVPVWIKLKAVNNVDLRTIGISNSPIIVDQSPPVAGVVYDGDHSGEDLVYMKDNNKICSNWQHFYDPESGIAMYMLSVGSEKNITDVANLTQFSYRESSACIDLPPERYLQHNQMYYSTVWAYNGGNKQLNVSVTSDGVLVDLTEPESGDVIDGKEATFTDLQFTTNQAKVELQWRNFEDPESLIKQYEVLVESAKNMSKNFEVIRNWTLFSNATTSVTWLNFHHLHRDRIRTTLKTTNGALRWIQNSTDSFIVDLTPPLLLYIRDGAGARDRDYQSDLDQLTVSFGYVDKESGVNHYKVQVYELYQGTRTQKYPVVRNDWKEISDKTATSHTWTGLTLREGARYSMRVGAINNAGYLASFETNGVVIDTSPPIVFWLRVGVIGGAPEEKVEGYVWQADTKGIMVSWLSDDPQSGIAGYQVAVGTSAGGTDVLGWKSVGAESSQYITGLTLELTNMTTKTPVYYVSMKAENGAGILSTQAVTSTPIIVVPEDKAGIVVDGAENVDNVIKSSAAVDITTDVDYQLDSSTVSVQFSGFESALHGVMHFEMAVGTNPDGGEEVLAYTDFNIVHIEETDIAGNGLTSSGYAQANLPLKPNTTYYTTLRGVTNDGNVLQTSSDGFTIDQSAPIIAIDRLTKHSSADSDVGAGSMVYESTEDSLSAMWHYNETESEIVRGWYAVGTYPYADDIAALKEVPITTSLSSFLANNEVRPDTSGKPNIVSVWAENSVGLVSKAMTGAVIIDQTIPQAGTVVCPDYIQTTVPVECTWTGFVDTESPIKEYRIMMGNAKGDDSIYSGGSVPGHIQRFSIQGAGSKMSHGAEYYVTVTAVNTVDMTVNAFSNKIGVDTTPPTTGVVVDLNSVYRIDAKSTDETVRMNAVICKTVAECKALDAICTESLTSLSITWMPFTDPESQVVEYQIAVGTSPGGGQVKAFYTIPAGSQQHTVSGLNLNGYRKLYVSVKGVNGAGLTSVATSDGVYISYLSQGKDPLSFVGVMDMVDGETMDVDFQTDPSTIRASWDVSGDPCPPTKYEWAIRRLDGYEISSFFSTNMRTYGLIDGLEMKNGETYVNYIRVTNSIGYVYTLRSNGVTIQETPLLPGKVYDGDIEGFDLNFLPSVTKVYANWNGFGLPADAIKQIDVNSGNPGLQTDESLISAQDKNQQVAYYMVALGTDRRFNKTRDNVVPYTFVGENTSVVFTDLELTPGVALYYFSVYAFSKSFSKTLVTSNGFYVGFMGGVTPGVITRPGQCVGNNTVLEVQWEGYTSKLDILMYYVAISNHTEANGTSCKDYIDGGKLPDDERKLLFNAMDVANQGQNTYSKFTNLTLEQGKTYYVWVMGTDKSGACGMTYTEFLVDITQPTMGVIRAGPWYNMSLSYTTDNSSITAYWANFTDDESGISTYEVSLWKYDTCEPNSGTTLVNDWLTLSSNTTEYQFVKQSLWKQTPYFVKLRVTNCAGLFVTLETTPVLFDETLPLPGQVKDGLDFTSDLLWFNDTTKIEGTFLHLPNPDQNAHPCPNQKIAIKGAGWQNLNKLGMLDPSGEYWRIKQQDIYVFPDEIEDKVNIKLVKTKDASNNDIMGAGAIYRRAEMFNGGTYKLRIQAADKQGEAVTEILFWDGPETGIATYKYEIPKEFENCVCCFDNPIPQSCGGCNCTSYLLDKGYFLNETFTTSTTTTQSSNIQTFPPYDVVDQQGSSVIDKPDLSPQIARDSCGVQIYSANPSANQSAFIVTWCRYKYDLRRMGVLATDININPSDTLHDYTVDFIMKSEDSTSMALCMMVYIDDEFINELCDVPQISTEAYMFFHVFKRLNQMPTLQNIFEAWATYATLAGLEMPPPIGTLCRSGPQFRAFTNPVIFYEAGIGTSKLASDSVPFRKVVEPCIPCFTKCYHFNCDSNCTSTETVQKTFVLDNINLPTKKIVYNDTGHGVEEIITYYLTVRAVTASGHYVPSSSDGFYVDNTAPVFDQEIMGGEFYYDVGQGNSTPAEFQNSNNTIKCIWKCDDEESGIVEYRWALGTSPGATDVMNYTSTGQSIVGVNSQLEGILQHDQTYYATITCENGAGLISTYQDTKGVTVKLIPPNIESVNTTIPGTAKFTEKVFPEDSLTQEDPTSVGFTFTKSEDPSVDRYDLCVGSKNLTEDIIPCTWVGYNISGSAEIKDGALWVNGMEIRKLSELRPVQDYSNGTNSNSSSKDNFRMPIGQQMFVTMRLCNKAMLCTNRSLAVIIIKNSASKVGVSTNGTAIEEKLTLVSRKRAAKELDIKTPSGLAEGQSIIVTVLKAADLTATYGSDASVDFVSYIQDPATSMDMVQRLLYKRFYGQTFAFSLVSLGNTPMPGPLTISYSDSIGQPSTGNRTMLLHWNPMMQYWEITSKTCKHLPHEEQEVYNPTTQIMTVKICDTYAVDESIQTSATLTSRKKRATSSSPSYFTRETMFIVSTTAASIYNSPPRLNVSRNVDIVEDSGTLNYQLVATDEEGDKILFALSDSTLLFGNASLTSSGFLTYTPCRDCAGVEYLNITMYENQTDPEIPPANSTDVIIVNIQSINDPPIPFAAYNGKLLLMDDITEPIVILREAHYDFNQHVWEASWTAIFGAYDVEPGDTITFRINDPQATNVSTEGLSATVPTLFSNCDSAGQISTNMIPCENFTQHLPHAANLMAWTTFTLNFTTPVNVFGNFSINLYFEDNANGTSLPLTVKFAVMDSPCHNGGVCDPTSIFPCTDTHRTHNFDAYYRCNCTGGYQGKYCEEDINECLSDPCMHPYVCYNNLDHYVCACPEDNPHCEILPWMISIILIIIIVIIILVVVGLRRHKKMISEKEHMLKNKFGSQSSLGSEFDMGDDVFLDDKESLDELEGFENPALGIEPYYDPEEERHYFNRHTKSNFTPLLDLDDVPPPPSYEFPENDHPHPSTLHAMNASKGPLGRTYLTPGTMPLSRSGADSGASTPVLKRHHKVEPVEDDTTSSHGQQETKSRCNTPDLFTINNKPYGPVTHPENPSRSATPSFGKHNKILPQNGSDSPLGSHSSGSNRSGSSLQSSPQTLEMARATELTFSELDLAPTEETNL